MPNSGMGGCALRSVVMPSIWAGGLLSLSFLFGPVRLGSSAQLSACWRMLIGRVFLAKSRSSPLFRCALHRHNDTDGELGNAACPSIAAEDLLSLLEYSDTLNLEEEHQLH